MYNLIHYINRREIASIQQEADEKRCVYDEISLQRVDDLITDMKSTGVYSDLITWWFPPFTGINLKR